ncbi:hypothetical protein BYT27DRAFT_7258058 [Phlegmacium glaucopus]|nr:hypothetical protein BYT27DRAFT_7258058 [Phlegmacium glaucopus]
MTVMGDEDSNDGDEDGNDGDEDGNDGDDDNNSYSYSDDGRGESNSSNVQTYGSDSDEDIYASREPSPRPDINPDINMDIEIDDAAAQAALHYSQDELPNPDNEDHDIDVIEDHRAHNRPVRPPHLGNLADAAAHQSYRRQLERTGFEDDVNLDNERTTEQNGETDNDEDNESSTGRPVAIQKRQGTQSPSQSL